MKIRLLFFIFFILSGFISKAQVLYQNNNITSGYVWNPKSGTDGKPIIMFDDINIPNSVIGHADSIGITQVKVAIGKAPNSPAVSVKLYVAAVNPADNLPSLPPKLLHTYELAAGEPSIILSLGDSINPFYTVKADTGNVFTGYQTFYIGASFSNDSTTNGWFFTTGPGFNDDVEFEYDSLNISSPIATAWFGGNPKATFYTEVYGKPIVAASPTPVTLKDFSVVKRNNQNLVTWKTETENNSSHFIIERSKNGHDFKNIGQVSAAGTSTTILNYQFTDATPLKGTNYYRLNSIDKDKKNKYSIIRNIRNYGETFLNIYPNPVLNMIKADLDAERSGKGVVSIVDICGKQVYSRQVDIVEGINPLSFDISNVQRGSYIFKIKMDNKDVIVKNFIKQ